MTIATETKAETLSFYVNGQWERPEGRTLHAVTNPATGEVLAQVPYATEADVDRIAKAAHEAFLKWRDVPVVDRVQVLYRYKGLLEQRANEVAAILTSENGKTADDARAEVRRMIQMVEVACGMPSLMMGDSLNDVAGGIDCKTIRQPIGVCAGITPFNFPAMVPAWMWPFAIACGNTFILKPSEKVPLTPTRAVELLHDAGLPPGVLNLVHGGKEVVDALLRHPLVRGISFVGSTPVAKYIYSTAAAEGKRVQALGGAKNHLIVMADADMPKTVEAIIGSAFGAAGERCLAGSVLVPVGEAAGPLLELLVARTKGMSVGNGAQDGVEMGPLVTSDHCRKVEGYVEKGVAEGATALVDGREAKAKTPSGGYFLGPTIFDHVTPEMTIAKEEIFGPVLSVIRVETLDDAIGLVNRSPFGNATAIFTQSGKSAREYSSRC
jgi:malonate-semialdehyde dehydrogenase (acetylating)/methylmalonate-semialdehyde dehydrogenase